MNKIKHLFILVCLSVLYFATITAQNNTLSIPDTLIRKSQTLSLPIYMENTDDIVANEITTAFGATPTGIDSTTSDTQRLNEVYRIPLGTKHSIVIDANGKKYMVIEK